jgi:hypothetical protein
MHAQRAGSTGQGFGVTDACAGAPWQLDGVSGAHAIANHRAFMTCNRNTDRIAHDWRSGAGYRAHVGSARFTEFRSANWALFRHRCRPLWHCRDRRFGRGPCHSATSVRCFRWLCGRALGRRAAVTVKDLGKARLWHRKAKKRYCYCDCATGDFQIALPQRNFMASSLLRKIAPSVATRSPAWTPSRIWR